MKFTKIFLLFIFAMLLASPVKAGILMVEETESFFDNERTKKQDMIYIDRDRIRVDTKGDDIDETYIFRKDKGVFWVIDNREKTLTEMTLEDLHKMKGQIDEAMRMFEEQMKDLPPEQRKMIEDMMKGQMPAQPIEEKIVYKKVASKEKVNKWVADKYAGYEGGVKVEEVWTTDWKALGLSKDDFKVFEEMAKFFSEPSGDKGPFLKPGSEEWEKEQGYPGIPVKSIEYSRGQVSAITELKEVKKQDFKSSLFEVPSGLKRMEKPFE